MDMFEHIHIFLIFFLYKKCCTRPVQQLNSFHWHMTTVTLCTTEYISCCLTCETATNNIELLDGQGHRLENWSYRTRTTTLLITELFTAMHRHEIYPARWISENLAQLRVFSYRTWAFLPSAHPVGHYIACPPRAPTSHARVYDYLPISTNAFQAQDSQLTFAPIWPPVLCPDLYAYFKPHPITAAPPPQWYCHSPGAWPAGARTRNMPIFWPPTLDPYLNFFSP